MLSAVGNSNVVPLRAPEGEPQLDPLSEKRAEQGRQLALAAMRADHAQKVQVVIAAVDWRPLVAVVDRGAERACRKHHVLAGVEIAARHTGASAASARVSGNRGASDGAPSRVGAGTRPWQIRVRRAARDHLRAHARENSRPDGRVSR